MPNTQLKFKCWRWECQHWFTFYQATTKKNDNGTSLSIYCPKCGGYVQKIQRVLTGRGTNLEPKDAVHPISPEKPVPPPPHASVFAKLDYLTRTLQAKKCPPDPDEETTTRGTTPPCGKGRGDTSPRMIRALFLNRDIAGVVAASTKRLGRKRVKR